MKKNDSYQIPSRVAQAAAKYRNCKICGKIFIPKVNEDICVNCYKKGKESEESVIDYFRHHQNASIDEIAKACHVHQSLIRKMVDSGKFDVLGENMQHPCKLCGTMVLIGDYCYDCSIKMKGDLEAAKESIKENVRMAAEAKEYATRSRLRTMIGDDRRNLFRNKK